MQLRSVPKFHPKGVPVQARGIWIYPYSGSLQIIGQIANVRVTRVRTGAEGAKQWYGTPKSSRAWSLGSSGLAPYPVDYRIFCSRRDDVMLVLSPGFFKVHLEMKSIRTKELSTTCRRPISVYYFKAEATSRIMIFLCKNNWGNCLGCLIAGYNPDLWQTRLQVRFLECQIVYLIPCSYSLWLIGFLWGSLDTMYHLTLCGLKQKIFTKILNK